MIHVAYGTSNLYAKFAGTSMLSLFDNTRAAVTVHILHDNTLTNDSREKFSWVAGRYNQRVTFHNVEEICAEEIAEFKRKMTAEVLARFSVASMFRLFLPKVISGDIPKIIYVDADTIVNLDVAEMWRVELGGKPIAAVLEWEDPRVSQKITLCREGFVSPEDYFNSGVLIMNLERLRLEKNRIGGGVAFINSDDRFGLSDQDLLNYCFSTDYLKLPSEFNCWVFREQKCDKPAIGRKIYHYLGQNWSFGFNAENIFHRLYWEYFARTPWFNAETILNLGAGMRKIYTERQAFAIRISALLSGKTRAFFVEPTNIPALKQFFAVNETEEIIALTSNESVQQLAQAMTESRGRKVFFILIAHEEIYKQLRDMLTQVGFAEWRDFVNAMDFLSEAQGVPFDAWAIIKDM